MDEHNGLKFGIFGFIVLAIAVGGFILMKMSFKDDNTTNKVEEVDYVKKDIRIDKDKEYIYFTNYEVLEEELDLSFSTVNINFKDSMNIAKTLNDENASFKAGIKRENEEENAPYEKLSYANYSSYELYTYQNYLSLVVKYYTFTSENFITFDGSRSYVFDLNSGDVYTTEKLLELFGLSKDGALNTIKEHVVGQNLLKEGETLDPAGTVTANDNLVLYVDKLGKLNASILVKSDKKDYNDTVILN